MDAEFSNLDDESLIRQILKGSHEAFATLVRRYTNRCCSIAYRFVTDKNDVEDIVQEAFLKLWHKPQMWNANKRTKFTTWFYTVVINLCLDLNKKKKPLDLPEDVVLEDENPRQDDLVDIRKKQALLEGLVRKLPQRQQLALNLCFYEGLTNKEAAEIIGVEVKAVQSLVMRAKTTLKKKVKGQLRGDST
jgi:RNA polymerase sigma-70 factor (ECF subfamily)